MEESDFELARETFGNWELLHEWTRGCSANSTVLFLGISSNALREGGIDGADPSTKEEFSELKANLVKKLQSLSSKPAYNDFIEDLVKDVCITCKPFLCYAQIPFRSITNCFAFFFPSGSWCAEEDKLDDKVVVRGEIENGKSRHERRQKGQDESRP